MPAGVYRDINMLLQAKSFNQTQELQFKMPGGDVNVYIPVTNMAMLVDMEQSEVRNSYISGRKFLFGVSGAVDETYHQGVWRLTF